VDDPTKIGANGLVLYVGSGATWANYWALPLSTPTDDPAAYLANGASWFHWTIPIGDIAVAANATGVPDRTAISRVRFAFNDASAGAAVLRVGRVDIIPNAPTQFPNGVVSVTFDDVYVSQYTLARPRMDLYGFAATCYAVKESVGGAGFLSLAQLQAQQTDAGWDIAAHSYTLNAHNNRFTSLSPAALDIELQSIKGWLLGNGFNEGSDHLAWPGGVYNAATLAAVRKYFTSARFILSRWPASGESFPPGDRYRIKALGVGISTTVATVQAAIDAAYANGEWLILSFHNITASPSAGIDYAQSSFNTIIDYLNTKGIPVRTVAEVLRS
jgi:peptidoglycan/xylan/chitin deacetylase (PgdA/CDA1 family)